MGKNMIQGLEKTIFFTAHFINNYLKLLVKQ